jgi:thiol-disulfide isomerase/thioredoxin
MGKASRIKQQSAREKIAAQRAAARKAEMRNRILITGGSVLLVVVIVLAFVIVKLNEGTAPAGPPGKADNAVAAAITSVPASVLEKVGKGSLGTTAFPNPLKPVPGSPAPLTENGKPEVLYMGAEYCPFCATERWAMVVALSRFGTFSNLHFIHSSADDNPASIPTLTFYKSSYSSKYVEFTPVEMQKVDRSPLQTPTTAQNALINKYDVVPCVGTSQLNGSIPFMDFGNKWRLCGASYSYTVLQGQSWSQVAAALHVATTAIAQGAGGTANYMTAAICKLTDNQPSNVCTLPTIKSLEGQI